MLAAPGIHPVPQGPVVDPQVPGHLRDRLAGRDHHLHGLSLELRAELAAMLRHETDPLSRAESHCPRSLIHLTSPIPNVICCPPGRPASLTCSAITTQTGSGRMEAVCRRCGDHMEMHLRRSPRSMRMALSEARHKSGRLL